MAPVARTVRAEADGWLRWLPIPSPVEPVENPGSVAALRSHYARSRRPRCRPFWHVQPADGGPMKAVVSRLLSAHGGLRAADRAGQRHAARRHRWRPSSVARECMRQAYWPCPILSRHLQACDVLVQPYPEGITSRRTSAMAALAHGRAIVTRKAVERTALAESGRPYHSGPRVRPRLSRSRAAACGPVWARAVGRTRACFLR